MADAKKPIFPDAKRAIDGLFSSSAPEFLLANSIMNLAEHNKSNPNVPKADNHFAHFCHGVYVVIWNSSRDLQDDGSVRHRSPQFLGMYTKISGDSWVKLLETLKDGAQNLHIDAQSLREGWIGIGKVIGYLEKKCEECISKINDPAIRAKVISDYEELEKALVAESKKADKDNPVKEVKYQPPEVREQAESDYIKVKSFSNGLQTMRIKLEEIMKLCEVEIPLPLARGTDPKTDEGPEPEKGGKRF